MAMKTPQPIETHYKGYRFRSRLEARWAVFFDAMDIPWRYESEGYELGHGVRYLPDFYLPDMGIWLEIKPDLPYDTFKDGYIVLNDFWAKSLLFAAHTDDHKDGEDIKQKFFVVFGTPGIVDIRFSNKMWKLRSGYIIVPIFPAPINDALILDAHVFAMTDGGTQLDIWPLYIKQVENFMDMPTYLSPLLPNQYLRHVYAGKGIRYITNQLQDAYSAATSARFEHGESPLS